MNASVLLISLLPALLMAAAVFDLTSYTIPNILPLSMTALFAILIAAMAIGGHPVSWHELSMHLLAGGLGLFAGVAFFSFGWVGGGDAKLFAAIALWLGWNELFQYALLAALLGGGLTLGLLLLRKIPLPAIVMTMPWFERLIASRYIPYGVSLSIAAITMWPGTELFRLAATN